MRKFLSLLLLPLATMILSSHAYAADPDKSLYDAAMAAIIDGGDYRIFTDVDGTKYYIAANGALTSAKDDACIFPFKKTTGGALYDEGIRIDVGDGGVFSNPPLNGEYANLNPGSFAIQRSLDRNDWERQVFFLDGDKYAIRTCNTAFDTWGWGDCGRTFWTYEIANVDPIPAYTYDAAFIWELESVGTVTVTYELVEADNSLVTSVIKKQESGSQIVVPESFITNILYDYDYEGGVVGGNCTVTVKRTPKEGVVSALDQLSSAKTYKIACDRGRLLTKDGYLASSAHSTLTNAQATEFAVINYEDNNYLYSVADKKFVTNTGKLASVPTHKAADAIQMADKGNNYFMFFFQMDESTQFGLNTNGNDPYGYVINNWMNADPGNQYYMVAESDFDPADAIYALDNFAYFAAMDAITDGATYRIVTEVDGTKFYLTTGGALTSEKGNAGFFTLNKSTGGALYNEGIEIAGADGHFSNTTLLNDKANLKPGTGVYRQDGGNNRNDWERQVFFLDGDKFAIRSCNTEYGESSWADAGRAFWTYEVEDAVPVPCYTYETTYVWTLEEPASIISVTYKLFESDGTTQVGDEVVVKQEAGSEVNAPESMTSNILYTYEISGTIGDENCEITIIRTLKEGVISSLNALSNNKTYLIACDRGKFLTKDDFLASTAHGSLTGAEATEFAIINYQGQYYLYSVADKKFVTNNGSLQNTLVNGPADAIQIEAKDGWEAYKFMFYFNINENTQYGLNTNGNDPYGYVINNWMTADPGNMYYMIEQAEFDPTEALKAIEKFYSNATDVYYDVVYQGEIVKTAVVTAVLGDPLPDIPSSLNNGLVALTMEGGTVTEADQHVQVIATANTPFEFTTNLEDAKWYNMTIRGSWFVGVDESEPYYPVENISDAVKATDNYQWAFVGNPYEISVYNKATGAGFTLTKDGDNAVIREGAPYIWEMNGNEDGFTLKEKGTPYNCINQFGGAGGPLQFWDSEPSPRDNGSTFRISEVPNSIEIAIGETGYATLYSPLAFTIPEGVQAFMGKITGETVDLKPLAGTIPASTAVVLKGEPGSYAFYLDDSAISINCEKAVQLTNGLGANGVSEATYAVTGYITRVVSNVSRQQQTFWMADTEDGGQVFQAYYANIPDGVTPFVAGQKVVITGQLLKYVNEKTQAVTREIKNADVVIIDNDLKGTLEPIDADGKYILAKPADKAIGFYKAEGTIPANKAYLEIEGADVKGFSFVINGETAIESITSTIATDDAIFDLSGRRVEKATKGVYIINGKKVLK